MIEQNNMNTRQQMLLQQIGIQQWVNRRVSTVVGNKQILWRDYQVDTTQNLPVQDKEVEKHASQPVIGIIDDENQGLHQNVNAPVVSLQQENLLEKEEVSLSHQQPISTTISVEENESSQTIYLQLQVLNHPQFTIIAQPEQQKEWKLFQNIQKACFAELQTLEWPLPLQHWSVYDSLFMPYIQGYFYNHQQKKLLILGTKLIEQSIQEQISLLFSEVIKMPSLEELLTNATEKRHLWQNLYPLIYSLAE